MPYFYFILKQDMTLLIKSIKNRNFVVELFFVNWQKNLNQLSKFQTQDIRPNYFILYKKFILNFNKFFYHDIGTKFSL
jgi:hypothetical protein